MPTPKLVPWPPRDARKRPPRYPIWWYEKLGWYADEDGYPCATDRADEMILMRTDYLTLFDGKIYRLSLGEQLDSGMCVGSFRWSKRRRGRDWEERLDDNLLDWIGPAEREEAHRRRNVYLGRLEEVLVELAL